MGRAGIEQYLYLLDEAFESPYWHSLLSNLKHLASEDWLWLPPAGARPIGEMVAHVGACKYMYGEINRMRALRQANDPWAFDDG